MKNMDFEYLVVECEAGIATIWIHNPGKANCLNETLWFELGQAVVAINEDEVNKVIIIRGRGKHFSSGIDIGFLKSIRSRCEQVEESLRENLLYDLIIKMQQSFSQFQQSRLPIIAMIHGACIGGAVDLISACDIRLCTWRSVFSIMEAKLGIVADMGTLQRLRFIVSEARLRELALTSRLFFGREAKKMGLVSNCFITMKAMEKHGMALAKKLTKMPRDALIGTKQVLNYSREHRVSEGLEYVARLNARALLSLDVDEIMKKL